jgi:hypothetical protein
MKKRKSAIIRNFLWYFEFYEGSNSKATVKPVYNSLGYNEAHRFHRSHRFLNEMIGYNENLFVINGFNCTRSLRTKLLV